MKAYPIIALIILGFLIGVGLVRYRADQGFVKDSTGIIWRLDGMMPMGNSGKYVAVYEKE